MEPVSNPSARVERSEPPTRKDHVWFVRTSRRQYVRNFTLRASLRKDVDLGCQPADLLLLVTPGSGL